MDSTRIKIDPGHPAIEIENGSDYVYYEGSLFVDPQISHMDRQYFFLYHVNRYKMYDVEIIVADSLYSAVRRARIGALETCQLPDDIEDWSNAQQGPPLDIIRLINKKFNHDVSDKIKKYMSDSFFCLSSTPATDESIAAYGMQRFVVFDDTAICMRANDNIVPLIYDDKFWAIFPDEGSSQNLLCIDEDGLQEYSNGWLRVDELTMTPERIRMNIRDDIERGKISI